MRTTSTRPPGTELLHHELLRHELLRHELLRHELLRHELLRERDQPTGAGHDLRQRPGRRCTALCLCLLPRRGHAHRGSP
ncbi:hypothetical protein [Kocuria sabuli]|uniref:hypothetical protein n=1 Tax=Kocuria sabuli TaxID=3071448 RepID=UPI0034D7AC49